MRTAPGTRRVTIRNSTLNGNTRERWNRRWHLQRGDDAGSTARAVPDQLHAEREQRDPAGFFGGAGGAIYNFGSISGSAKVVLQDCTLSGNNAPNTGGIYNHNFSADAVVTLRNTILKTDTSGGNFLNSDGTITSLGHNLSNDDAGGPNGTGPGGYLNAAGDMRNTDPLLGPLQDNGGPTFTHALLNGSPAINRGANSR